MARPPASDLDIFEDVDLARSQDLLKAEAPPPRPERAAPAVKSTQAERARWLRA